ncbi:DUF2523 domain-containing protein [Nitrosomonas oligotropha]|nr:DUF2523 domain-containing protein [Nitrosomonas oligotropha]
MHFFLLALVIWPFALSWVSALALSLMVLSESVLAQLFSMAQGYYNAFPSFALQVVGLAGFGQGIGIIVGAISFRLTFVLLPKLGVIPK